MSTAHGQDTQHLAAQAHAAEAHAAEAHGGDLPPVPAPRHITPAPEDYVNLPGASALVWPLLWCVVVGVLIALLLGLGWGLHHNDSHGAQDVPADAGH